MKKLKITERQAKLLGLNKLNESGEESGLKTMGTSLGAKPVRVIIYGGIVPKNSAFVIKRIKEKDPDSNLNFFEVTGKIVGTVSDYKIPLIKVAIATIDPTITFEKKAISKALKETKKNVIKITKEQYNRLIASGVINENSDVAGGLSRVDKTYKKAFTGKDIQNLKPISIGENDFNIQKPNTSLPISVQGKFGKPMLETQGDIKTETLELIKYLYRKSENFSPFWAEHDLTFDDICYALLSKGLIISSNGKHELSKTSGSPEQAIQAVETELSNLIGSEPETEPEVEAEPEMETEASNYPAGTENNSDSPWNQNTEYTEPTKTKNAQLVVVAYDREIAILKSQSGELFVLYYYDINKNDFFEYAEVEKRYIGNDEDGYPEFEHEDFEIDADVIQNYVNDNLTSMPKGVGIDAFEKGVDLVKIDEPLKNELISLYDKNKGIVNALSSSGLEEMTSAASSGAFTPSFGGPMGAEPIKRELNPPVVGETTSGSGSMGAYDANALPGIGRNGEFKPTKKTKAQTTPQLTGGSFVKEVVKTQNT